jgi:hypothetical protein
MQDDLLNGNLTCEETLSYTARLRCPQDTNNAMRKVINVSFIVLLSACFIQFETTVVYTCRPHTQHVT